RSSSQTAARRQSSRCSASEDTLGMRSSSNSSVSARSLPARAASSALSSIPHRVAMPGDATSPPIMLVGMKFGIAYFPTDYGISTAELAPAVEERGFESLWVAEHTHIPVSRL